MASGDLLLADVLRSQNIAVDMRATLLTVAVATFTLGVRSQDKVTLSNGDIVNGKVVSMAEGQVTIRSTVMGEVVFPITEVTDIATGEVVTLQTKEGHLWRRRILGMDDDNIRLDGEEIVGGLRIGNLDMINPPTKEAPKWSGSLKTTALYTSGNTRRESAGVLFDASRSTQKDRVTVDAIWNYGTDQDGSTNVKTLTQRRTGGGAKYDFFLSERWYALGTARALGDTLADLKLRFTSGLGFGYTIIDDGVTMLLSEGGLSYYVEDYRTSGLASEETISLRIAYRLEHQISEDTKLVHRVEAFPSIEDGDDYYLQAVTELTTSLTDSMVASVAHTIDYDNTPAVGRKNADNRVLLTVGWTF